MRGLEAFGDYGLSDRCTMSESDVAASRSRACVASWRSRVGLVGCKTLPVPMAMVLTPDRRDGPATPPTPPPPAPPSTAARPTPRDPPRARPKGARLLPGVSHSRKVKIRRFPSAPSLISAPESRQIEPRTSPTVRPFVLSILYLLGARVFVGCTTNPIPSFSNIAPRALASDWPFSSDPIRLLKKSNHCSLSRSSIPAGKSPSSALASAGRTYFKEFRVAPLRMPSKSLPDGE